MKPELAEPMATAVVEVLDTVAELRRASETALRARQLPGYSVAGIEASLRADAYVRELTERVQSRARSAGLAENDLLAAAYDVLKGRRRLPPTAQAEEAA